MTIGSLLYYLTIATCLALAALIAERLLHSSYRPTRWPWVGAILLSTVLPWMPSASGLFQRVPMVQAVDQFTGAVTSPVARPFVDATAVAPQTVPATPFSSRVILPASMRWFPSIAVFLFFAIAWLRLMRWRRGWRRTSLLGTDVLVSGDTGPAVIGFLRPGIVVPAWALTAPTGQQEILLQHEAQHLRARDPQLLLLAGSALVLAPWNLVLWWVVQRLRQAIEVDCDRRVLNAGADAREYGACLVSVAERTMTSRFAPAMGIALSSFSLERRLRTMLHPARSVRPIHLFAGLGAVAALVLVACSATPPSQSASVKPVAASLTSQRLPKDPAWYPDSSYLYQAYLRAYGATVPAAAGKPALYCVLLDEFGDVVRQSIGWDSLDADSTKGYKQRGADHQGGYTVGRSLELKFPDLFVPNAPWMNMQGGTVLTIDNQQVLVFWGRFSTRAPRPAVARGRTNQDGAPRVPGTPDTDDGMHTRRLQHMAEAYYPMLPSLPSPKSGGHQIIWFVFNHDWSVDRHSIGADDAVTVPDNELVRVYGQHRPEGPVWSVNASLERKYPDLDLRNSLKVSDLGGGIAVIGGDTASVFWARYAN